MTLRFSLTLTMSHNVKQDNVCPVLHVQQLFSGQGRLKASFSDNGPSPCQQKQCQPWCQLGTAPVLAVDDSRALKHNVGGFQFIDVCARISTTVFCFETACHSSLSATSPPLVLLA